MDNLLNFVQAGQLRANEITQVRVDEAVRSAVALIENKLSRRSLRYEHQALLPDLVALGDQEQVSRILVNLLANAVRFTARGGEITTQCGGTAESVQIRVIDNGMGIHSTKLEQIFEPVVPAPEMPLPEGGVGLGLAFARDLARGMHGDLSVDSTRGVGSCFTLTLPRASGDI